MHTLRLFAVCHVLSACVMGDYLWDQSKPSLETEFNLSTKFRYKSTLRLTTV